MLHAGPYHFNFEYMFIFLNINSLIFSFGSLLTLFYFKGRTSYRVHSMTISRYPINRLKCNLK